MLTEAIKPKVQFKGEFDWKISSELVKEGAVIEVPRSEVEKRWTASIYFRPQLIEKLKEANAFWDNDRVSKLYVDGPPGCGKTCFFHIWARLKADQARRVMFVQVREEGQCFVWILEPNGKSKKAYPYFDLEQLYNQLDALLKSDNIPFDLCVVDGIRSHNSRSKAIIGLLNTAIGNDKVKKNVFITSLEFSINLGEQLPGDGPKAAAHSMGFSSWVNEDYVKAVPALVKNKTVCEMLLKDWIELSGVDKGVDEWFEGDDQNEADELTEDEIKSRMQEAVELKYHYAGGSARFMFDLSLTELKKWFDKTVKRVENWESFAKGDLPEQAHRNVNSLMQRFPNVNGEGTRTVAVSEYILLHAYQKVRNVLTTAIAAIAKATGNAALRGWSFELEQLDRISDAVKDDDREGRRTVGADEFQFFVEGWNEIDFDGASFSPDIEFEKAVIWCLKWNQGCFDAAFFHDKTLYTIQFTVCKTHSLKLRYIKELVALIRKKGIKVDGIVHIGVADHNELKFDNPDDTNAGPDTRSSSRGEKLYIIKTGTSLPMELKVEKSTSCTLQLQDTQMYKVRRKKRKCSE